MFLRSRVNFITFAVALMLMLGALVMVATTPAAAVLSMDGDYEYRFVAGGVEITKYYGTESALIIPSNIDGFQVVSIGDSAFASTDHTLVLLPEGVTSIGDNAFENCHATINLPGTLQLIGNSAFAGCTGLNVVTIPNGVISIGNSAFEGCGNLNPLTFENPSSLQSIGTYAFASCASLQSITIPASVTSIGTGAFQLDSVLTDIDVNAGNSNYASLDGVLYNHAMTALVQYPGGKTGDITIPNGVTTIRAYSFYGCNRLQSVIIPSSVTAIGDRAFQGTGSLVRMEFLGNQPTLGVSPITNHAGLKIYYHYGATGFGYPTWLGITTVVLCDLEMHTNYGTTSVGGTFELGASVTLSATPPTAGAGEQYVWNGWTGSGPGAYTGSEQTHTITIGGDITETANWTHLCQVTFEITSDGGGSISPAAGTAWYEAGNLPILATPSPGYAFSSWTSDTASITFSANSASAVATINGPGKITAAFVLMPVEVLITSSPTGSGYVLVDGSPMVTPGTYSWLPNTVHTLEAVSAINIGTSEKLSFISWSDGGALSHSYTVTMAPATITATFDHQYLVTISADSGDTTPTAGSHWYEAGSIITIDANPPAPGNNVLYGVLFVWEGWSGTGIGSYSGSDIAHTITVNGPITEAGGWTKRYLVTLAISPDATPAIGATNLGTGPHWYDAGSLVTIQATPSNGYLFSSWSSNSTSITFSAETDASTQVMVEGPGTITAIFEARPVPIRIESSPSGSGYVLVDGNATATPTTFIWYPGQIHNLAAVSEIPVVNGERYSFSSWSDGGPISHAYTVTIEAETVIANFNHQYHLTMATSGGTTTPVAGTRWVNASTVVSLDAVAPPAGTGYRYVWNGWTGTGTGSYTGTSQQVVNAVTVGGPITETAQWTRQYQISFGVTPAGGGTVSPSGVSQWVNAGRLSIQAFNATDYMFSSWTSGTAAITFDSQTATTTVNINGTGTITANFVLILGITVTSNPTGSGYVLVDGNPVVTPMGFRWASGTVHTIEAISSVAGVAGERYQFTSWNDLGPRSHTYTVTSLNATVIANFDHQFLLTMATNLGTTNPEVSETGLWQSAGTTIIIDAAAPAANSADERYQWAGWTGTGSGNYTGVSAMTAVAIVMYGPITETARWNLQYQVTMVTNFGTTSPLPGVNWFDAGSVITLTATAPAAGTTEQYTFVGWTGTGIQAYNGVDNPAIDAVTVNGPITETAFWTLHRAPGEITGLSALQGDTMVSLSWNAPSDGGLMIDRYVVFQDGVEVKSVTAIYATITGLTNGQAYSFTVAAHNAIGNGPSPAAIVVTPMAGANSLILEIISPITNSFNNTGSVWLVWNVTDFSSAVVKVEVSSELYPWTPVTGTSYLMSGLAEGPHTLYVRATDAVNNVLTRSVPIVVDLSKPVVTMKTPKSGGHVNSLNVTFSWMVSDNGSGVFLTEVSTDGSIWMEQTVAGRTATYRDGTYKFYIRATDNAGNVVTAVIPFTVDTVSPTILMTSPGGNAESTRVGVNITFNEEMDRASTLIMVAGVNGTVIWDEDSASFTPVKALKGWTYYTVSVKGHDLAGNAVNKTWTFRTAPWGTISGVVRSYDGKTVANAVVKLIGGSTAAQTVLGQYSLAASSGVGKVMVTTTDINGAYAFYDVVVGNYTLEVTEPGHQSKSTPVSMTMAAIQAGISRSTPEVSPAGTSDGLLFMGAIVAISVVLVGLVKLVRRRRNPPALTGPQPQDEGPANGPPEMPGRE